MGQLCSTKDVEAAVAAVQLQIHSAKRNVVHSTPMRNRPSYLRPPAHSGSMS